MVPLVTFSNHYRRKCHLQLAVCLPFGGRNNPQTEAKPYSIRQRRKAGKCKRTNEAATIVNSSPLLAMYPTVVVNFSEADSEDLMLSIMLSIR